MNTSASSDLPAPLSTVMSPAPEIHDCWNRIGVSGDRTCPELKKYIHCRNCPVYSAAGARLLDHPVPPGYQREWTAHFAEPKKLVTTGRISVVIFRVGPEWLALPTQVCQEVAERGPIHSLPHRRHGVVLGLVNIRGALVVCVSVGRLFVPEQKAKADHTAGHRLLVANWNGHQLAFPVDEVVAIHRYHPDELKLAPTTTSQPGHTYLQGVFSWREHSVGCLDEELLFATLNRSLT